MMKLLIAIDGSDPARRAIEAALAQAAQGQAAQEIVRRAADLRADGIVMGTRGMNALGGLLLGSVAQRVVHLAAVPAMPVK